MIEFAKLICINVFHNVGINVFGAFKFSVRFFA